MGRSTSTQWLRVDLKESYNLSKVAINWHSDNARSYQVQVSSDGSNWTTVKDVTSGRGGREEVTFSNRTGRYLRIECRSANSSNGYAINELEVYQQ